MKTDKKVTTPIAESEVVAEKKPMEVLETKDIKVKILGKIPTDANGNLLGFKHYGSKAKAKEMATKIQKNELDKKTAKETAKALEIEKKRLLVAAGKAVETAKETFGRIQRYINDAAHLKLHYRLDKKREAVKALGQINLLCVDFPHNELQQIYDAAQIAVNAAFGDLEKNIQIQKDKDKNLPLKGKFDGLKL